jgi:hypothetical protein
MIIKPPDDEDERDGNHIAYIDIEPESNFTKEQYERIRAHATLPVWMCPVCNCKNSHDNLRCVYCWIRNKVITDKP